MLVYLFLLVIVTFTVYVVALQISLDQTRSRADQVIAGSRQADATELNRYITRLTAKGTWPTGRDEQDQQRIEQLRNIRNNLIAKYR